MSKAAFDPNKTYRGFAKVPSGPESWADRLEVVKDKLREDITCLIPPAFRDQVRWVVTNAPGDLARYVKVDSSGRVSSDASVMWVYFRP